MGIDKLNKILSIVDKKFIIKSEQKLIQNHLCCIDFSILVHKMVYTSHNIEEVYKKIKLIIVTLKNNNNNVLLFIDPDNNIKKKNLTQIRALSKLKQIEAIKKKIESLLKNKLKTTNFFNDNSDSENMLMLDYPIINIKNNQAFFDIQDEIKYNFDDFSNNSELTNLKKEIDDFLVDMEMVKNSYNDGYYKFLILQNRIENYYSNNCLNKTTIEEIVKNIFYIFILTFQFNSHNSILIDLLLLNNVITEKEIIISTYCDAEVNIFQYIKYHNIDNENTIIFSADQDVLLFSLLKIKKSIKINQSFKSKKPELLTINSSIKNKNTALLVFLCNKSDYFPGIKNYRLSEVKIQRLLQDDYFKQILNYNYENINTLFATFCYYIVKKKTKNKSSETNANISINFNLFLKDMINYFNISKTFFNNNLVFDTIYLLDIYNYFVCTKEPILKINKENEIFFEEIIN